MAGQRIERKDKEVLEIEEKSGKRKSHFLSAEITLEAYSQKQCFLKYQMENKKGL